MKVLFVNAAPIIVYGLGQAFSDSGHVVKYVNIDFGESLEQAINDFSPDFVFNDGGIDRMQKLFPLLSDRNIPHVYWAIEDPTFYGLSLPYAVKSSLVLTPCKESIYEYARHGIKAHLFMFACHPRFHRRVTPDNKYKYDLVFIGNNYDYHLSRMAGVENIIKPALNGGYDTKIYGNEWWLDKTKYFNITPDYYGGYLPNECLPAVCSSSKIVLGVHSIDNSETMMSMRTFEILGSAGFYLTQWTYSIECLFKNHYHLVWSKSSEETSDLIKFYLAHPELRNKIAQQGQAEVYANHTYHKRIKDIEHLFKNADVLKTINASKTLINSDKADTKLHFKTRKACAIKTIK